MSRPTSAAARSGPLVPWRPHRVGDDPVPEVDIDRLMVFVPAIMSVGLVFSVITLLRDLFHWTGGRARERRTIIEAGAVVSGLVGDERPDPAEIGVLSRPTYLISAIVLVGGATYVAIGSVANFIRDDGYVRDIGWLLAVSLGLAVLLGFLGGVALTLFLTWPHPPAWTFGPLRTAPLSVTPGRSDLGPSWTLTASTIAAAVVTGMLALIVGSGRSVALEIDEPIAQWLVETDWLQRLAIVDPFGRTIVSIALVTLIGLSAFRCRVMALVYPVAFLVGWIGNAVIQEIVERPRPTTFGNLQSFPSGHMVQAVFIAGLLPLALGVLLSDKRAMTLSRVVLGSAVVATALYRIHNQDHWPLDALAGITLGLAVVLAVHWAIEHRAWHRGCDSCPWSAHPADTPWDSGLFVLKPRAARLVGMAGTFGAVAASSALITATLLVGLPRDPEGSGFGSAVSRPVQLSLAGVVLVAGLIALRWKAAAAVMMAFAALGIGLFASIQYSPMISVALTAVLLVPAVLIWLAWQRTETIGRIATLAAVTVTLLTSTALGSIEIHGHYFGPTHPESVMRGLASEEADWLWLGNVGDRSATIMAGGFDPDSLAELRIRPALTSEGVEPNVEQVMTDQFGLARFVLTSLEPGSAYSFGVDEAGRGADFVADAVTFRTFESGPQDLVVALGSCARVGSNGAVFDTIVAEDPDLYIALGDLHYGNLESTDPADHIAEYARSLSQPGQSALFSSVPTAYVWDDHDFGPNDSDSSSVSRPAVSQAYRAAVPHTGVDPDPDATIAQAFTVGRVRFVLSDTRSSRTGGSMLGEEQQRWLIDELTTSSKTHALVVWVNPTPWIENEGIENEGIENEGIENEGIENEEIGTATRSGDDWSAYPEDRRAIADALARSDVLNLVMVSGDAHMVAIDDGTNSGYATDGSAGFPVLHAGALDRPGSVKGGPYSHGAFPGAGQYGKLVVQDDGGSSILVRLSGHTWEQEELVALELEFDVGRGL